MENLTTQISAFPFIGLILGSIVIFSALRLFKIILLRLIKRTKYISQINKKSSIFELLVWLLYIMWIIPRFYVLNISLGIILSLILVIAILLIAWYAGKDFISGFIIKSNTGFKINSRIKTKGIEGVIIDFYPRNLKLLNDKGEKVLIPYSNLIGKNILIKNTDKSRISKHITLKYESVNNYDEIISKLKFMIMMHPKALVNITPSISIVSQKGSSVILDINISARDSKGLAEIESTLKNTEL